MRTAIKIILIFIAFVVLILIIGLEKSATGRNTTGIIGTVSLFAFIAGVVAIWKYNPKSTSQENDNDKHQLDKS